MIDVDPLRLVNAKVYTEAELGQAVQQAIKDERERCAEIAERMRPTGGRMWTDEQHTCYDALTHCADNIRDPAIRHSDTQEGS